MGTRNSTGLVANLPNQMIVQLVINHVRADHRLDRNSLQDREGGCINAVPGS
jgi:hypothetical protein